MGLAGQLRLRSKGKSLTARSWRSAGRFVTDFPATSVQNTDVPAEHRHRRVDRLHVWPVQAFAGPARLTGKRPVLRLAQLAPGYRLRRGLLPHSPCEKNDALAGKTVCISGSGNVATAAERHSSWEQLWLSFRLLQVVIYDPEGIDVELLKTSGRFAARIKEYSDASFRSFLPR